MKVASMTTEERAAYDKLAGEWFIKLGWTMAKLKQATARGND